MNSNLKKLMDAGVLNVSDPSALPQDLQDKIAKMSDKDIDALSHIQKKMDPELFKSFNQFIFP